MGVRPVCLDADDAVELAELLELLSDWLDGSAGDASADSLRRFLNDGYELWELRADLARFTRLVSDEPVAFDRRRG